MIFTEQQQQEHAVAMMAICQSFQKNGQSMVLKGGAALSLCLGHGRFCEALHLDSTKLLNLEHGIRDALVFLGKGRPLFRGAVVSLVKKTASVHRYRVDYGDKMSLKIEDFLKETIDEADLVVSNGILTYKTSILIKQKIAALQDRGTARDLHDVIFLYAKHGDHFDEDGLAVLLELYHKQSDVLTRFNPAYEEAAMLDEDDLIDDLMNLVELVEARLQPA